MVLGEESFVALLTDEVSFALVGVHVFLQVVGLQEAFVALRALNPTLTVREEKRNKKIPDLSEKNQCER